jgi:hypothetical protein
MKRRRQTPPAASSIVVERERRPVIVVPVNGQPWPASPPPGDTRTASLSKTEQMHEHESPLPKIVMPYRHHEWTREGRHNNVPMKIEQFLSVPRAVTQRATGSQPRAAK